MRQTTWTPAYFIAVILHNEMSRYTYAVAR